MPANLVYCIDFQGLFLGFLFKEITNFKVFLVTTLNLCLSECPTELTLAATAQLTSNQKSYQLSKPEIEFHLIEEMYVALRMCTCAEKTTFLGKDY